MSGDSINKVPDEVREVYPYVTDMIWKGFSIFQRRTFVRNAELRIHEPQQKEDDDE